jgi:hypothetical protein
MMPKSNYRPCAQPIAQWAADGAKGKVKEPGYREDQRDIAPRPFKVCFKIIEKRRKRIGNTESEKQDRERSTNHEPAEKYPPTTRNLQLMPSPRNKQLATL